jgi:hypothetical protein
MPVTRTVTPAPSPIRMSGLPAERCGFGKTIEQAVRALKQAIAALRRAGWDRSVWDHRRVIHSRPDKVHLDVQFTRYRKDGSVIGVYPAVYVVVGQGGAWLIQARSSFAP